MSQVLFLLGKAVHESTVISVEQARSSQSAREQFLSELVRDYSWRIDSLLWNTLGATRSRFPIHEAKQAFLIRADRAIDTAVLTDDGRGKNDPRKWCGKSGLDGVRDAVRAVKKRMVFEKDRHIVLDLNDAIERETEAFYGITEDVAEAIVGEDIVKQFILTLTDRERAVVELLLQGYGHRGHDPHSGDPSRRYNYLRAIANKLGCSQDMVLRIFRSLRKKASYLNG